MTHRFRIAACFFDGGQPSGRCSMVLAAKNACEAGADALAAIRESNIRRPHETVKMEINVVPDDLPPAMACALQPEASKTIHVTREEDLACRKS